MRIACLQYNPILCCTESNRAHVSQLLDSYERGSFDLLVLPEHAFTGYVFTSKNHIRPFAEDATTGPTVKWAIERAQRLNCRIIYGFPQLVLGENGKEMLFNSMNIISETGTILHTYQKANLFTTDETWADEGPSYHTLKLGDLKVGLGICNDLNPYRLNGNFEDFEFAKYQLREKADIIICAMNWLHQDPDFTQESTIKLLNYWALRLKPLWGTGIPFVACNRFGSEADVTFAGSSCGLLLTMPPQLIDVLDGPQEGILILDVNLKNDTASS